MLINDYNSTYSVKLVVGMIIFGTFHKKINDVTLKKWTATLFGFFLTYLILGVSMYQDVFIILSSLVLIKSVGWRHCHYVGTGYAFLCVTLIRVLHQHIGYHKYPEICLHQMLWSIKLVSLSYDIHLSNRNKDKNDEFNRNENPLNPTFMDLFHYMFTYVGMVMGPLIRYRTYKDYLNLPFSKSSDFSSMETKRMLVVYSCAIASLILGHFFPIQYIVTEEFRKSNFLYKNLLNYIYFLRFEIWMTSALFMANAFCGALGVGAYPAHLKSVSAHGPKEEYEDLKKLSKEDADKLKYDFETVNTMNVYKIHTTPWISEFWRNWNTTAQYCMGRYFYREMFKSSFFKDYRVVLTMFVSALWHGIELGYFTSLVMCGVYIMCEKPYLKMYKHTKGWVSVAFFITMWLMKVHILSYFMVSFIVLQPEAIRIHAAAMNYVPYISLLFFYVFGKLALPLITKKSSFVHYIMAKSTKLSQF